MTRTTIAKLKAAAKPDCPDCQGEGILSIVWNNDPSREEDVACDCIYTDADGQPQPYEPPEPDDENLFIDIERNIDAQRLK